MLNEICITMLLLGIALLGWGFYVANHSQMDDYHWFDWMILGAMALIISAVVKLGGVIVSFLS